MSIPAAVDATGSNVGASGGAGRYAVVHLVVQEFDKDLIGPQVIDGLAWQLEAGGDGAPAAAAVLLLEPARVALTRRARERARALRARAAKIDVRLAPFVGRLGIETSARWIAPIVRTLAQGRPLVLHCRTESAVPWAVALRARLGVAGIVLDVRGAWPEEMLLARGIDDSGRADGPMRVAYDAEIARLLAAAESAGAVLAVSDGLIDWLHSIGVRRSIARVPCCGADGACDDATRARVRAELGVSDKLVLVYAGTIAPYQDVDEGFARFAALAAQDADVHVLCLTPDVERMRASLARAGLPAGRSTVLSVDQTAVARHLCAADAAFLLRRSNRVNQVSSPIKFAEYLASGVPVVVSRMRGGWDPERLVEGSAAGVVVDWFDEGAARAGVADAVIATIRASGALMRRRARALYEREFRWSSYTGVVRAAYIQSLQAAVTRSPGAVE